MRVHNDDRRLRTDNSKFAIINEGALPRLDSLTGQALAAAGELQ
jgi:hypothetical protein